MSRILIVDDAPAIRAMLRTLFEEEGYTVVTAPDGYAALELLGDDPPDLIITDVKMPRLDGWQLLRRVREQHPTLPAILISAVDPGSWRREIAVSDHTVFVRKPFDLEDVLAVVARLVGVWVLAGLY